MQRIGSLANARYLCGILLSFAVCGLPNAAEARPPEIRNLNIRGLQIGGATTLTIDGADLLPAPKLFLDRQAIAVTIDPQSTATRLVVAIPLPDSFAPGISRFRLATDEGFSNSQLVGLDRFPQLALADKTESIPAVLHGSVPGSGVSRTTFPGQSGQDVILEVEARRLGSKLRPVIHLFDSRRVQLAWSSPLNLLAGDTRISLKLPRDDQYTVEIHDAQYAPPGPSYFRLKIGQWQFADLAFPPAVARGQETAVDLLGNVAGLRSQVKSTDAILAPVPWPDPKVAGGVPPSVLISSLPEVSEVAGAEPMVIASIPVAISGRLNAFGQRDRFQLPALQAGTKLVMDLFAERIGSPVDAVLEVRNKLNAVIASNDDAATTTDPRLELTVPADQDPLVIFVRDNLETGTDASIYRLVITPADVRERQFDVVLRSEVLNVAAGETQVLEAIASRQDYDGEIQLHWDGLPGGVTVQGTVIPAGANGTLISVTNSGDALAPLATGMSARSPDGTIVRPVRIESTADDRSPVWLRQQFAIATTPKPAAPFRAELPNEASLVQLTMASKPTLALKLQRPPSTFGPIRVSLAISQPVPRQNGQPNQNLAIRAEKPVEIPVDNAVKAAGDALAAIEKQLAESVKQAQGAQGDAKPAADAKVTELAEKKTAAQAVLADAEAKAVYQVDYAFIVPASIVETACDVAVRAELLNPERNTVLRTTYTPVKRLVVVNPLSIKLATPGRFETILDPKAGASVKISATIERLADYKGDVTVTAAGLPPGVTIANVIVKGDQTDFSLEAKLPANFAAAEITGVKLTATGPPDPQSGNIPVKSAEVAIAIKINKPEPPAATSDNK